MSKQLPIAIKVKGRVYKLAKRFQEDWEQEYTDEEEPREKRRLEEPPNQWDREPDPRGEALWDLLQNVHEEVMNRVIDRMNSGEITEEVQHQLADLLNNEDVALSMVSERSDPNWFLKLYKKIEDLSGDPDVFKVHEVKGLEPKGPIKLQDLVLELIKAGHLKGLGFTLGVGHDTYWSVRRKGAPLELQINGKLYRRADEGPEAPASDPKQMSPEAVLAADFGIPPTKVEELKGYKDGTGTSLYEILRSTREDRMPVKATTWGRRVEARHPAQTAYEKIQQAFMAAQQALTNFEAKMPTSELKAKARQVRDTLKENLLQEVFKAFSEAAGTSVMTYDAQQQ